MDMDLDRLCERYQLGRFRGIAALDPGTSSRVWRLDTDCGPFLVRTLSGWEQGERERDICCRLRECGFTAVPAIPVPYFEQAGQWYQVQEFCPGPMPDPGQAGMAARIARTVERFTAHMPAGLIHGNLGLWNMVVRPDGLIKIIDLGSVREGDPCFDWATAFAGIINHTADKTRISACREFLAELDPDREQLLTQLRLWAEEGIARWHERDEAMTKRFYHALKWAEEHIYEL